jgi:hypothetical protein
MNGNPGFKLLNSYYEDVKFFIAVCQSLNIPFFTVDEETGIKKCGLRNKDYINKLMILKKLVESKSIEMWLNKTEIEQWRNNPYPNSVDAQPTIHYDNDLTIKESITYGMFYDNLYSYEYPEIKFCYLPGSSSYNV